MLGSSLGNGLSRLPLKDLCDRGSLWAWHGHEAFPIQCVEHTLTSGVAPSRTQLLKRSTGVDIR
jgi:hypothetical protein